MSLWLSISCSHTTYRNHDNLYLMCNTKIDKVILENGRATALRTVPTKVLHTKQPRGKIIKARKQIVLSCGTLSTPLALQRSGISDPEKLQKVGVKCQVELPGIGLNFEDHYLTYKEELRQDYMKEFRPGWDSYFKNKPDKPVMHYSVILGRLSLSIDSRYDANSTQILRRPRAHA